MQPEATPHIAQACRALQLPEDLRPGPHEFIQYRTQILFSPAGTYYPWMKLKNTICGPKVHDVGYRPTLMELAFGLCLRGFEVFNDELNDQQAVVALVEGDDARVNRFRKMADSTQPPLASF